MGRWDGASAADRLRLKADTSNTDGCWPWLSALNNKGYGSIWLNGRRTTAHRAAYMIFVGPLAPGMTVDHLCRNRACVNPKHLEAVTHAENCRRGRALVTACPQGHSYTVENTRLTVNRCGGISRGCKACHRDRERVRRARLAGGGAA